MFCKYVIFYFVEEYFGCVNYFVLHSCYIVSAVDVKKQETQAEWTKLVKNNKHVYTEMEGKLAYLSLYCDMS